MVFAKEGILAIFYLCCKNAFLVCNCMKHVLAYLFLNNSRVRLGKKRFKFHYFTRLKKENNKGKSKVFLLHFMIYKIRNTLCCPCSMSFKNVGFYCCIKSQVRTDTSSFILYGQHNFVKKGPIQSKPLPINGHFSCRQLFLFQVH